MFPCCCNAQICKDFSDLGVVQSAFMITSAGRRYAKARDNLARQR